MARSKLTKANGDGAFLYEQLGNLLRERIQSGTYAPGERLPSMDKLAAEYKINKITVLKALTELRREGYVYSRPAQGTYVAETLPDRNQTRNTCLRICVISQVLVAGDIGPYHHDVLSGMQQEVFKAGGLIMILPQPASVNEDDILSLIKEVNADGVVYLGLNDYEDMRALVRHGPPSVVVDQRISGEAVDSVIADNVGGARLAVEHLLEQGHKHLGIIEGLRDQRVDVERMEGVQQALANYKISAKNVKKTEGGFTRLGGYEAMKQMMSANNRPTAVFCFNDEMAVGAMQAVHEHGQLRIPRDISVVGFDNIGWALATHPPLTTVHVDRNIMGQFAITRLLARIQNPGITASSISVDVRLEVRGSTASPAKS